MLATKDEITKFIPQRNPIVMVHNLIDATDEQAVTELFIEPSNVFVSAGALQEPGLVENIAQTAAVYIGYQCTLKNIPIPIGYIAAIRNLKIFSTPAVNATLTTTVNVTNKVLDLTVVEGKVEADGKILCSCEMRVFTKGQS